jgi:nuclear-control-of-ATPase protein 2
MAGLELGQGAGEEVSRYTVKMRRALCALGDIHPMSEVDGEDMARGDSTLLMLPGTPLPAHDATNADASPLLTEPLPTTNTTTTSTGGGGPTAPAGDTQHTHQLWQELQHLTLTTHEAESHVRHMLSLYRAPTRKEVTWVYRYARNGAVAAAAMYVGAHSRLNGSPDLERWGQQVVQSVSGFFQEHLVQPMSQIASELQGTFAANDEADTVSLRESRNILGRMLADFDRMHPEVAGEAAKLSNTTAGSMERVLAKFEAEAKSPIRSLVTGDLSNLLMIQMQSMKVQMESALIQMDRILAANEINFAAMAAMPFFATLYGLMTLVRRLSFGGRGAEARREQQRRYLRMLLVEAERALVQCNEEGEAGALEMGLQIFCVNALYVAVREQRPLMSGLEWYNLKTDILELAGPKVAVERKLRILGRMHQSYSIF